jgi:hypothetical protein
LRIAGSGTHTGSWFNIYGNDFIKAMWIQYRNFTSVACAHPAEKSPCDGKVDEAASSVLAPAEAAKVRALVKDPAVAAEVRRRLGTALPEDTTPDDLLRRSRVSVLADGALIAIAVRSGSARRRAVDPAHRAPGRSRSVPIRRWGEFQTH